jgi:nitroreductase
MDFHEAVTSRRMTRRFAEGSPVPPAVRDRLLAAALTAPTAGNSQGVDFLVLEDPAARRRFFEMTADRAWLGGGGAGGILAAPLVVLPIADPAAYVDRYSAPDKSASSLAGLPAGKWPVPYWLVDAAFATMLLLLGAADAGLGALFFRLHRPAGRYLAATGVPAGRRVIGAVAIGHPAPDAGRSGPSRPARRSVAERTHLGAW